MPDIKIGGQQIVIPITSLRPKGKDKRYIRESTPVGEGRKHKSAIQKLFLEKVNWELCADLNASKVIRGSDR